MLLHHRNSVSPVAPAFQGHLSNQRYAFYFKDSEFSLNQCTEAPGYREHPGSHRLYLKRKLPLTSHHYWTPSVLFTVSLRALWLSHFFSLFLEMFLGPVAPVSISFLPPGAGPILWLAVCSSSHLCTDQEKTLPLTGRIPGALPSQGSSSYCRCSQGREGSLQNDTISNLLPSGKEGLRSKSCRPFSTCFEKNPNPNPSALFFF